MSLLSLQVPDSWDPSHADRPWRWRHDSGARGALGDGQALPPAREVRLVLPASQVLQTVVDLPRRGRWQEALPYALEDRVLTEPDRLHVAAGEPTAKGLTPVAAVDRQWLDAILARVAAYGLRVQTAYTEASLATRADAEWTVLIDHEGSLLTTADGAVTALDAGRDGAPPRLLATMLARLPDTERPVRMRVRARPGIDTEFIQETWPAALALPVMALADWDQDMPAAAPPGSINLLQGRFAPAGRTALPDQLLKFWPALALLAASLLVWLVATLVQTIVWQREASALRAGQEAALRRAFPETRTVLDVPLQMRRGLEALRGNAAGGAPGELPALLARTAGVAQGLPARLQKLDFHQGQLQLTWSCPDAACAATLRAQLREPPRHITVPEPAGDPLQVQASLREATP